MAVKYREQPDPIRQAVLSCRPLFLAAVAFSLFVNVLMLAVPIYTMQVLDRVLSSGSHDTLLMLTFIAALCIGFVVTLQALRAVLFSHIGRWMDDKLSSDLVERTARAAIYRPGIGSQPLRDLSVLRNFVTSQAMGSLFDAPWAIIFFITVYAINITMGIVITVGAVVLFALALITEKIPAQKLAAANEKNIEALRALDSILRNAEIIKAMGLFRNASAKWKNPNQEALTLAFSASNATTVLHSTIRAIRLGLQTLIIGLGAWFVLDRQLTPGGIIAVSILASRALAPFDAAVTIWQNWVNVKKAHGRILDMHKAVPPLLPSTELPEPRGAVKIEKLAWQEPRSRQWVLAGINISVGAGEAIGVIGPSGAGKTTLARLLVNVLAPTSGAVRLDGAELGHWNPDQLARHIGYLPQDVELFSGTVAFNVARLDDGAEDDAVIAAAQLAEVHEFILSLPEGYRTEVGHNGAALSAGQRQRVALARAFFGMPRLVVLDEPNANLDTDGETGLAACLANAKGAGITTFVIAHRPSILQRVDNILVLHGGQAKLYGPTAEILAQMTRGISPARQIRAGGQPGGD